MNPHFSGSRTARRAFSLFLTECALDRTRGNLPLRDIIEAEEVDAFHEGLERLLRSLLRDYSLEKRSALLARAIARRERRERLH